MATPYTSARPRFFHSKSWAHLFDDPNKLARRLRRIIDRSETFVAFAGHFNAGKTTLISALLRRAVFPVSAFPETGIECRFRSGEADVGLAISQTGNLRPVECSQTALGDAISIYTADGMRRLPEERLARLDLSLTACAIPKGVAWIDSPGINDSSEMTARTAEIAFESDVLVWVLDSRQCLSEPEAEFIYDYTQNLGTEALYFLVNVFLPEDSIHAWDAFNGREREHLESRICERASRFGFANSRPPVFFVTAKPSTQNVSGDFGKAEFRKWLYSLNGMTCQPVRHSRACRLRMLGLISGSEMQARFYPNTTESHKPLEHIGGPVS